jgi:hypothetical protein
MELGFETIGNATLICHDGTPVLATDPWLDGSAYFGSWIHTHQIPEEQREHVRACPYLWISHGHPDHLSLESLEHLRDKEILLPDHFGLHGGRISRDLAELGYRIRVLKDGEWTRLSDNLRVCSIGNYYQDAALLVDLGGSLIVNSNDSGDLGAGPYVKSMVEKHGRSFLLALTGYGDADMINFFDEEGQRIPPPAMKKEPFGQGIAGILEGFGIDYYVPFAAQHKYQRTDSAWANQCITPVGAHHEGFESKTSAILPAFVRFDLAKDEYSAIDPPPVSNDLHEPSEFGDDWAEELHAGDREKIEAYFRPVSHLRKFLGYVNFRVGGQDNRIEINPEHERGITFETPRASLMTVIEYRIFDDLLIGNFTKTTLHGPWDRQGTAALYPEFAPPLKYADQGDARSAEELRAYFAEYRRRGFFACPQHELGQLERKSLEPYLA